jgi:hypothetical protein
MEKFLNKYIAKHLFRAVIKYFAAIDFCGEVYFGKFCGHDFATCTFFALQFLML